MQATAATPTLTSKLDSLLARYVACFKAAFGIEPLVLQRDRDALAEIAAVRHLDEVTAILDAFIRDPTPFCKQRSVFSLSNGFAGQYNALLIREVNRARVAGVPWPSPSSPVPFAKTPVDLEALSRQRAAAGQKGGLRSAAVRAQRRAEVEAAEGAEP